MTIYQKALEFKKKYPKTVAWRLKQNSKIAEIHLNPDEKVRYVFAAQKNHYSYEMFRTFVVVITDKRLILAQKRLLFGYLFVSITPDMYNDLTVMMWIFWGRICIDTIKEKIILSNIQKESLPEIETEITQFMMEAKKNNSQD